MTIREVCNIVYEEHKDLFKDSNEVYHYVQQFLYALRHDIRKLRPRDYGIFETILTEEGKRLRPEANRKYHAHKNRLVKEYNIRKGWVNFGPRADGKHIDIYFDIC